MRDITFRGIGIESGKWYYGDLSQDKGVGIVFRKDGVLHSWYVKPETVGQYTGVKDTNGVYIYEGDILKYSADSWEDSIMVVYYDDKEDFRWKVREIGISNKESVCDKMIPLSDFFYNDFEDLEIIGNIHDNPELLNQQDSIKGE
jgi:uncharacterized phage protein (TIGR01671 family)